MGGGRRVWGAWIVFMVIAAPSSLRLSRLPRHAAMPVSHTAPRDHTASLPRSYILSPLYYLSTAPADSLVLLPGIGPVLAARIADARSGQGPFSSWDDLRRRVAGIGEKSVARLRRVAETVDYPIGYWVKTSE